MLVHVFPEARCIGYAWSWSYRWLSAPDIDIRNQTWVLYKNRTCS